MSTIEKASKRLEELRKAGIETPWASSPAEQPAAESADPIPVPVAAAKNPPAARLLPPKQRVEIDLDRLERICYVVPRGQRSALMNEFRSIKHPLLANVRDGKSSGREGRNNLIMVTSALPGEGKTFTAVNLAMSIAMEVDQKVMLVDADTIRMGAADRLGLKEHRGLLDILADPSMALSEAELSTNVDNFTFLSAGTRNECATELLSSQAMRRLLDLLAADQKRIVVFDAPPLLPSAEARVLAPQMGQVLIVVRAGKTPQGMVMQALGSVESCPLVMTLLNQSRARSDASRYGYYYYSS
ncbi:MAG: AAA family ATPase [Gammaproteobacteria bacterium]|nr:AAA family ATPase [Gammaproteobacteria bacterium]